MKHILLTIAVASIIVQGIALSQQRSIVAGGGILATSTSGTMRATVGDCFHVPRSGWSGVIPGFGPVSVFGNEEHQAKGSSVMRVYRTGNSLTIHVEGTTGDETVNIIDIMGNRIVEGYPKVNGTEASVTLSSAQLPSGLYFVVLRSLSHNQSIPLFVTH
jgi:hypothetical protein